MEETEAIEAEVRNVSDPHQKIELLFKLTTIYWRTDQKKMPEVLKEMIGLARDHDNKQKLLMGLWYMGSWYRLHLKIDTALQYFNDALALSIEIGERKTQARIVNSLGVLQQNLSKFPKAIEYFEESRDLSAELGDTEGEAICVMNIGVCHHNLGRYSEAMQYYLEAKKLYEKAQEFAPVILVKMIGGLAMEAGDTESALKYYLQAQKNPNLNSDLSQKALLLTDIGTAYYKRGEFKKALKYYDESSALAGLAGDKVQHTFLLCMRANLLFEMKDFKKAWETLEEAHAHLAETDSPMPRAMIFHFEAVGYKHEGEFLKAKSSVEKSLELSRPIGNTKLICAGLLLMGLVLEEMGDFEGACQFLKECIEVAEKSNYKGEEYHQACEALCRAYEESGDLERAIAGYKEFLKLQNEQAKLQSEFAMAAMLVEFETEKTAHQSELYRLENIELAEANERLMALGNERREFISIAAHDLKNPLYSIKMLLNFLKSREAVSQEELLDVIGDIETATVGMLHLIQNLLDAETIENGKLNVNLVEFPPADIVKHITQRYKAAAQAKNITMHLDLDSEAIVMADTQYFMQATDNLISNAIKYSPFEKNINVRLLEDREKATVRLEIQDEGPGISADDMTKLFGKFQRLSARPTGNENSTGLGLSIVKKLVEAMNGTIHCESEWGNGSTFIIELPAA
jgi:signal transduction histidine kinase